jgi:general secretion pathway protein G
MVTVKNEPQPQRTLQRGFTLIELLVVVTIIGILAGLAIINVRNAQRKAAEKALRYDLYQMRQAIDNFYADKQRFPGSIQEIVDAGYMRKIPIDPITQKADTWIEVHEEPDPNESFPTDDSEMSGPGISDIKSGAEGQTLDDPPVAYADL